MCFFKYDAAYQDVLGHIEHDMEKCRDHKLPLYMCFIDYSKAFDCVSHNQMWEIMMKMGFPKHLIDLTCKLYEDQEPAERTANGDTEWF